MAETREQRALQVADQLPRAAGVRLRHSTTARVTRAINENGDLQVNAMKSLRATKLYQKNDSTYLLIGSKNNQILKKKNEKPRASLSEFQ